MFADSVPVRFPLESNTPYVWVPAAVVPPADVVNGLSAGLIGGVQKISTEAQQAAQAQKTAADAANQAVLTSTLATISSEKTAYDNRMAQDVKDRQAQTAAA